MIPASGPERLVIDTNVLVSAVRSRRGASAAVIQQVLRGTVQPCLSVALYSEWRDVLTRVENLPPGQTASAALEFARLLAFRSHRQLIHFRLRPVLRDPADEHVLELAFAVGVSHIVTHNLRDFAGSERYGARAITPGAWLQTQKGPP